MSTTLHAGAALVRFTVGRKILVALTGLFMVLFLAEHLIGNLNLLLNDGGRSFDEYSHGMVNNPLIRTIEIVLFASFAGHIALAYYVNYRNYKARPVRYHMNRPAHNSSWFSRNMVWTGSLVFIFLVIHLGSFFWPYRISHSSSSPYELAVHHFSDPLFTGFYVLSMVLLCAHLLHGFNSGFQTLGLKINKQTDRVVNIICTLYSVLVCTGFAVIPLYVHFAVAPFYAPQ